MKKKQNKKRTNNKKNTKREKKKNNILRAGIKSKDKMIVKVYKQNKDC